MEKAELKKQLLEQLKLGGSREEAIAKAITDLSDEEKLEFFTLIFPDEDDSLALMMSIAENYNLVWLKKLITTKLKLRTSIDGWRSKQIEGIASEKQRQKSRWSMISRFFRRGKTKRGAKGLEGEVEGFE